MLLRGHALELRETYTHLVRAFDRLSPLLKTTIALTMMQGLSYPEAAVVLDTTEGTIAWRIHEARKQMRQAIEAMQGAGIEADIWKIEGIDKREDCEMIAEQVCLRVGRVGCRSHRERPGREDEPQATSQRVACLVK